MQSHYILRYFKMLFSAAFKCKWQNKTSSSAVFSSSGLRTVFSRKCSRADQLSCFTCRVSTLKNGHLFTSINCTDYIHCHIKKSWPKPRLRFLNIFFYSQHGHVSNCLCNSRFIPILFPMVQWSYGLSSGRRQGIFICESAIKCERIIWGKRGEAQNLNASSCHLFCIPFSMFSSTKRTKL